MNIFNKETIYFFLTTILSASSILPTFLCQFSFYPPNSMEYNYFVTNSILVKYLLNEMEEKYQNTKGTRSTRGKSVGTNITDELKSTYFEFQFVSGLDLTLRKVRKR